MGFATHLGPWLLGTVKETTASVTATNAANGLVRNTGVTNVTQTFNLSGAGGSQTVAGCVIPAGSILTNMQVYVTTAFTAGATLSFQLNSDAITGAVTITAVGAPNAGPGADGTRVGFWNNTGSVDKVLNAVVGGAPTGGVGVVVVTYAVRNSDGTSVPANP